MYKIMVVEDDRFYRYEIVNYLKWEDYDFTICSEAINGRTAMEQMDEKNPDIIFTDISMPEMNGIELIRQVREKYPDIIIVVLSSYSDFSFVKEAMKLGAMDYILKHSVRPNEMLELLGRIHKEADLRREKKKKDTFFAANFSAVSDKYFRRYLLDEYKPEDMVPFWESVGWSKKPKNLTLLLLKLSQGKNQVHRKIRHALEQILDESEFIVSMNEDEIVILFSLANEISELRILEYVVRRVSAVYRVITELDIHGFSIGISDIEWDMSRIHVLYNQAELAQALCIYNGYDKAFFYSNVRVQTDSLDIKNSVEEITNMLHEGQICTARNQFHRIIEEFRKRQPEKSELQNYFFRLMHIFYRVAIAEKIDLSDILGVQVITEKWCSTFKTLHDMEKVIDQALDEIEKRYGQKIGKQQVSSRQVQMIMNYIEKNYMNEISLDILSEEFCLTPNYLCKVFKNSTGIKLTQYINQVRITGAKKLIRQTNLHSHEIAEMVGFSSPSYYSTIFKQVTGMTVSEYKNSIF